MSTEDLMVPENNWSDEAADAATRHLMEAWPTPIGDDLVFAEQVGREAAKVIWPLAYRAGREDAASERIQQAIDVALEFGGTDGAHHKMWTIDQMLRRLVGDRYEQLIAEHEWDEGIAP